MIRAVLDANVFVSGMLGFVDRASAPAEVMRLWRQDAFDVVASIPLIDEILRTLYEAYFLERVSQNDLIGFVNALFRDAKHASLDDVEFGIASHVEDDFILATAAKGRADVLVTGDKQFLRLREHRGVRILTSRAFLAMLSETRLEIVE